MTANQQELNKQETLPVRSLAMLLLIVALLALSLTAILIKLSLTEISANSTVFNRLWIASIIFGLGAGFNRWYGQKSEDDIASLPESYQKKDVILLVVVAVIHVLGRFFWTWCLTETSAANGTVLSNSTPLFSTLGAWLFLKQSFNSRFLVGMGSAIAGVSTLAFEDFFGSNNNSLIGDGAALLSAVFYAASFLILEYLRTKFSVTTILVCRCVIGAVLMLPVVLIFEDQIFPVSVLGWGAVFGLAAICEVLGHGLVVYCLKYFSSAFVTIFLLLEPVIAAILAWIIFSETLSWVNLFGFGLIIEGIYLAKTGKGSEKLE